jgi:hypothetical protein
MRCLSEALSVLPWGMLPLLIFDWQVDERELTPEYVLAQLWQL